MVKEREADLKRRAVRRASASWGQENAWRRCQSEAAIGQVVKKPGSSKCTTRAGRPPRRRTLAPRQTTQLHEVARCLQAARSPASRRHAALQQMALELAPLMLALSRLFDTPARAQLEADPGVVFVASWFNFFEQLIEGDLMLPERQVGSSAAG